MCDDVYIIIHGRLGLEERRILVVDVPTLEISAGSDPCRRTKDDGSIPLRYDDIVTKSLMHEVQDSYKYSYNCNQRHRHRH